jgi:6-phosphogluconolactonase
LSYLYVGSYGPQHDGHGAGVVTFGLDPVSGRTSAQLCSLLTDSPGFLAVSPSGRTLYAAHLVDQGKVTALRRLPDGGLQPLGVMGTGGRGPCHVLAQRDRLIVCNFHSGSVAVVPLAVDESFAGTATVLDLNRSDRIAHPHGAWELPGEDGQVVVTDLGLDTLTMYVSGGAGLTAPSTSAAPAGAGPRHVACTPSGDLFVSDELGSTVSRYVYDRTKRRFELTASLPTTSITGTNYPSDITVSADDSRVYVLNRGSDTISVFDSGGGTLRMLAEVASGGQWPLHCVLIAERLYVANLHSDRVSVHQLHERTGIPVGVAHIEIGSPACLLPVVS